LKAIVLTGTRGPDSLQLVDLAVPKPATDEILVRIRAVSLNYRDLVITRGAYRKQQKHESLIPTSDAAGEVVETGAAVAGFQTGDRVIALFYRDWLAGEPDQQSIKSDWGRDRDGMLCQYKLFKAQHLVRTPSHLSDLEAACLPCAGLTAWNAIIGEGKTRAGDLVLTQGTGGVSLFALQFAKIAGARVIVTSSADGKLDKAKSLGADHAINYRAVPDWGEAALAISQGGGVDQVVELGGTQTLKQSLIAIRPGGTISMIGVLSGATFGDVLLPFIVSRRVRMQGITVGNRDDMEAMCQLIAQHSMRPVIDRVYELIDARSAFQQLQSGGHFGKVCIAV